MTKRRRILIATILTLLTVAAAAQVQPTDDTEHYTNARLTDWENGP